MKACQLVPVCFRKIVQYFLADKLTSNRHDAVEQCHEGHHEHNSAVRFPYKPDDIEHSLARIAHDSFY